MARLTHPCIDCRKDPPATIRKIATAEGEPARCRAHLTAFKVRQRKNKRANHVERTYDISAEDNHALYIYQGGKCWICRKATGASKSLAVEHDHADDWVRGRCCSTCNQFITRQLGEDPEAAQRLVSYFSGDTPFRRMLAERWLRRGVAPALSGIVVVALELTSETLVSIVWTVAGKPMLPVLVRLDDLASMATPKS